MFCSYCSLLIMYLCLPAEIVDYGYPQKTDSGVLKTYITQQGIKAQVRV